MSMAIKRFVFGTTPITTVVVDDEPWFVAQQLTQQLGYINGRKAVLDHVDEEDRLLVTKSDAQILTNKLRSCGLI